MSRDSRYKIFSGEINRVLRNLQKKLIKNVCRHTKIVGGNILLNTPFVFNEIDLKCSLMSLEYIYKTSPSENYRVPRNPQRNFQITKSWMGIYYLPFHSF